ncbi:MAG: phosphate signaling complex protein PhoU [Ignavibacteriales bacterium]|nr:phosphate signaling complex protein PhoU [Ignavibacteriales bacterium]
MTRHYEQELDQLRTMLIRMGSLVEEQIDYAVKAITEADVSLANLVIERDKKVDEFDIAIDQRCMAIFALSQPVAIDLRLLMAALKINNELERIGDIAANLGERVSALMPYSNFVKATPLRQMADAAREMVKHAIDSFVNNDPELAKMVLTSDDVVDCFDREIFSAMIARMKESPENIAPASHLMIVSRHIERLADHATNIAEDVIFLVNAKIIKHHAYDREAE